MTTSRWERLSIGAQIGAIVSPVVAVLIALGVIHAIRNKPDPVKPDPGHTAVTSPSTSTTTEITSPVRRTIINCHAGYRESGPAGVLPVDMNVPAGQIAFVDTLGWDGQTGPTFVIVTGPYSGHHTIANGAYCYNISTSDDYGPVEDQRKNQLPTPFRTINLPGP